MKQSGNLQQKLQQKQVSVQTIRLTHLLECNSVTLEEEINKELELNPALERELDEVDMNPENDEPSFEDEISQDDTCEIPAIGTELTDYYDDDEYEDYSLNNKDTDSHSLDFIYDKMTYNVSFIDSLREQLNSLQIDDHSKVIAEYIIGNLDENGWLTQHDTQSIVNELLLQENLRSSKEEVENVISNIVQQLDPPGVAARTLQESLLLQLKRLSQDNITVLAINIIANFFDEFSKKHKEQLLKLLKVDAETLQQATKVISKLNPFPNSNSDETWNRTYYIIPDFLLAREGDNLILSLNNEFIPKLKIDVFFEIQYQKIKSEAPKEDDVFIKEAVENARSFIAMLEQREQTLFSTMTQILMMQKDFFMTGNKSLIKPMILKDIAEKTGLSESTISRISNGKYVRTEFGDFFLKSLFSEGVGDKNISSIAIKDLLSELIAQEDPKHPLTDQQLCNLLKARNNNIERRTVAKYREDLGIPVYRQRRLL